MVCPCKNKIRRRRATCMTGICNTDCPYNCPYWDKKNKYVEGFAKNIDYTWINIILVIIVIVLIYKKFG